MRRLVLAATLLVASATAALAAPPLCDVADDPCVVDRNVDVDDAVVDLQGRALVVASGRTIRIATKLVVTAGAVTLAPNARVELPDDGELEVHAAGDVRLEPGSAIVASTFERGRVEITASGSIVMRGAIRANSASRDGEGGRVFLTGARVDVAGDGIQAHGGNRWGTGGEVVVAATAGDVTVSMPIVGRGGEGGGAVIDIDAADDIVVGPAATLDASATAGGSLGAVFLLAIGDIDVTGDIRATGTGDSGGGGEVDIDGADVSLAGTIDVSATGRDTSGGLVSLSARDLASSGRIVNRAQSGDFGFGGIVQAIVDGTMTVTGPIDLSTGFLPLLLVDAQVLRIAALASVAGDLHLAACTLEIAPEGEVSVADEPGRPAILSAGRATTIAGTLRTVAPAVLEWSGTPPVIAPDAQVSPPPMLVEEPGLFCPAECGDGIVDGGEQCDDGNRLDYDCCSAACTAEPEGNPCDDGLYCTYQDVCDGAGACTTTPVVCDACEQCSEQGLGCVTAPKSGCHAILVPGGGSLDLKNASADVADRLTWRWRLGAATSLDAFGDPLGSTDYALCVYDGADLLMRLRAPHGSAWRRSGRRGVRYAGGAASMSLLAGEAGKASIVVKSKGAVPSLGLDGPVSVQLESSDGACWTSTFSDPSANVAQRYKGRSD